MIVAVILLLAAAAAAWCVLRRRKYPLAPGLPPLNLFVVPAALVSAKLVAAGNAALARAPLPEPPAGVTRRRIKIPGPNAASLPLTLYAPENAAGPLPCLVYLHGGGFCCADAGYIHENVMDYARLAGCRVVFVHYRTSEKAAFPAAFADACAALRYAWDNAAALGIDRMRLAVGGDSAGDHPSWAAPMLAERFDGLPPAYVEVEQFDCLHDEGIAYATALQAAGVSVQVEDVRGTFHGFDVFRKADLVKKQIEARSRALRTAFEKGA